MELIFLPLILGILSFIIPKNLVRFFGLLGSLSVLGLLFYHLYNFDNTATYYIFNPEKVFPLGLTFKMGYDSLAMLMLLMTNVIMPLIFLSNFNRSLASDKLFTGLAFFMLFGLNGVFLSLDAMLFYIFCNGLWISTTTTAW